MSVVELDLSPKQSSKLRNGHRVSVRPAMKGEGVCVVVRPETYDIVSRAFGRGKGAVIALNPEELMANAQSAREMEGRGIFGKRFDKGVEKLVGKKNKKAIYSEVEKRFKEPIKKGIQQLQDYAPELGASALGGLAVAVGQPEFAPIAGAFGAKLGAKYGDMAGNFAQDYLENPSAYNTKGGSKQITTESLNKMLGTNMGYLERAGLANAKELQYRAGMMAEQQARDMAGMGLMAGSGLYVGSGEGLYAGRGFRATGGQLGGRGQRVLPQALSSQPYSANFQFRHTLPPAYQKVGKGLYA